MLSINQVDYVLGTLSFNIYRKEFSYHFTYPHNSPLLHLDCEVGNYTGKFEHITWHKNVAHIKREDNVAVEQVNFTHGPLFLDRPAITPIYVESLYFQNNRPCLKEATEFKLWKGSQSQKIFALNASSGFSIVFLLVPAKINTSSILAGTQFVETPEGLDYSPSLADLCNADHRPGRIQFWNDWDFLVIPSPFTCRILSISPIIGDSFRLLNYRNTQAALTDLLLQASKMGQP